MVTVRYTVDVTAGSVVVSTCVDEIVRVDVENTVACLRVVVAEIEKVDVFVLEIVVEEALRVVEPLITEVETTVDVTVMEDCFKVVVPPINAVEVLVDVVVTPGITKVLVLTVEVRV